MEVGERSIAPRPPSAILDGATRSSCLVPECDGASLSRQREDALWQQVFTAQPARRRVFVAELQASQESTRALATRYGLNAKTVAKWRQRTSTADTADGTCTSRRAPCSPRSKRRSSSSFAVAPCCRSTTYWDACARPYRPCLAALFTAACSGTPSRSCRRLKTPKPNVAVFAQTTIGYVHIDACELRCAEGKVHMFLAIDRVSKFTYVELHPAATMLAGAAFLAG